GWGESKEKGDLFPPFPQYQKRTDFLSKKALTFPVEHGMLTKLSKRTAGTLTTTPAARSKKKRLGRKKALTKDGGCGKLVELLPRGTARQPPIQRTGRRAWGADLERVTPSGEGKRNP